MSSHRRRMMMTKKPSGGGSWEYELHLTPEWINSPGFDEAYIDGDWVEFYDLITAMVNTLGDPTDYSIILYEIPSEFIFTVDGYAVEQIEVYTNGTIRSDFDNGNIEATLFEDTILLYKYLLP